MKHVLFLATIALCLSCKETIKQSPEAPALPVNGLITQNAMVVSARAEASKIGSDIMENGGNAFDAMVATELALAVTYPYAGNLGGGGFMVYRTQYGEVGALDYREKAPMASHKNMYLDEHGTYVQEKSKTGGLAVGVPGTIAGIFAVHEKLGSLPIEELIQPVIELANRGYVVTPQQADRFNIYGPVFEKVNGETSLYTQPHKAGDTIKNKALANTLSRIDRKSVV